MKVIVKMPDNPAEGSYFRRCENCKRILEMDAHEIFVFNENPPTAAFYCAACGYKNAFTDGTNNIYLK